MEEKLYNPPRAYLWFRKQYYPYIEDGSLTTIFRPDDRRPPHPEHLNTGEIVTLKIIEKPGNEAEKICPQLWPQEWKAKVLHLDVHRIDDLMESYFIGSSPDVKNPTQLREQLSAIYGKAPYEFDIVTRIILRYGLS